MADTTQTDDQYAAQIHDYVVNVLFASINPSDDEIEHGYANVRTWLDSIGVTMGGVEYMQAHQDEAIKIATGPAYETLLATGAAKPVAVANTQPAFDTKSKTKLAVFVALMVLGIWYLFFKDSQSLASE